MAHLTYDGVLWYLKIFLIDGYLLTKYSQGQYVNENSTSENRSEYDYPTSGMHYGQSFLCISVDGDQFDKIGLQLMYNQVVVYRNNIPSFAKKYPVLSDAAKQKRIRKAPYISKTLLKSSDGVEFVSFAKSDKWQKGKHLWHFCVSIYCIK